MVAGLCLACIGPFRLFVTNLAPSPGAGSRLNAFIADHAAPDRLSSRFVILGALMALDILMALNRGASHGCWTP